MLKNFMNKVILISLFSFILAGCSKDEVVGTAPIDDSNANSTTFNRAVRDLSSINNPVVINPPQEVSTGAAESSGDYMCTTKRYKAAAEYNEMLLLSPLSQKFYPGALIKGESISTGEYIPIVADRKPITISISLNNIEGSAFREVQNPNVATVRDAVNELINSKLTGKSQAHLSYSITNVYSEKQLSASIGANYSNATVDLAGSFDFSNKKVESSLVIKFVQKYFSIDMNPIANPSDLFIKLPDVGTFGSVLPSYIASVNYGRMILFTATSSYSNSEMNAAFDAAFKSGVSSGGVKISAAHQEIINNSSIKAFVLGGSGTDAAGTINGIEGVKSYILNGGEFSKDSPAAPLSYLLNNVTDNAATNVVLATEYNVRQCNKVRTTFKMTMVNIDCSGVTNEGSTPQMFGHVRLTKQGSLDGLNGLLPCYASGEAIDGGYFWNKGENNYQTATAYNLDINSSKTFTIDLNSKEYVFVTGQMYEEDTGGDDNLGTACKKLYAADLIAGGTFSLNFNGDGDAAKVNFLIEPLD